MVEAPNPATLRQITAADPGRSTWLTANAGSGKTRVLTDRVARLLLAGTRPERVLCLTYTKAAASEMQNRLFKRLGEWAMMPEPALRDTLATLGEGAVSPQRLSRAHEIRHGLELRGKQPFTVEQRLLLMHQTERGVVHKHDLDVGAFLAGRHQFLDVHQD